MLATHPWIRKKVLNRKFYFWSIQIDRRDVQKFSSAIASDGLPRPKAATWAINLLSINAFKEVHEYLICPMKK